MNCLSSTTSLSLSLSLFVTCSRALNWLKFWGGFSLSVAVEELKISGAEVPATVAPAEPSLNDRF